MEFIKSVIGKILIWYNKPLGKGQSLAIAGVNATLFALIIASVSVYMVFAHTSFQQIEVRAFGEAAKVNNLDFIINGSPFGGVDSDEFFETEKLHHMMRFLVWGADDPDDPILPKDIETRAKKALGIMRALVSQHPFPELSFMTEDGRHGTRSESKPVSFENLNEVQEWIDSMNNIFGIFSEEVWGQGMLLPLIKQYNKSQDFSDLKEMFQRYKRPEKNIYGFGRSITSDGLDLERVYYDYMRKMEEAASIVRSTQQFVTQANALARGYPAKFNLIALLVFTTLPFYFGVIYPLTQERVKCFFALRLPLFFYFLIGAMTIVLILK